MHTDTLNFSLPASATCAGKTRGHSDGQDWKSVGCPGHPAIRGASQSIQAIDERARPLSGSTVQMWFTSKEAARVLRISHRTLEDWRLKGNGPKFQKVGRLVRYSLAELSAFTSRPAFSNTAEAAINRNCG